MPSLASPLGGFRGDRFRRSLVLALVDGDQVRQWDFDALSVPKFDGSFIAQHLQHLS
jgi:hypothetical protein